MARAANNLGPVSATLTDALNKALDIQAWEITETTNYLKESFEEHTENFQKVQEVISGFPEGATGYVQLSAYDRDRLIHWVEILHQTAQVYILYFIFYTLYFILYILYFVFYILYFIFYIFCILHFTLFIFKYLFLPKFYSKSLPSMIFHSQKIQIYLVE